MFQGKNLHESLDKRHLYYNGWTLTNNPNGKPVEDDDGKMINHPEFTKVKLSSTSFRPFKHAHRGSLNIMNP
jgi:hypothetical protein